MKLLFMLSVLANIALAAFGGYQLGIRHQPLAERPVREPETSGAPLPARNTADSVELSADARPKSLLQKTSAGSFPSEVSANEILRRSEPMHVAESANPTTIDFTTEDTSTTSMHAAERSEAGAPLVRGSALNSSSPGNSFTYRGTRVALAEIYDSTGPEGRAMAMDFSPASDEAAITPSDTVDGATAAAPSRRGRGKAAATNTASPALVPFQAEVQSEEGMSLEDELFRMKWGWAAFDAARSQARREASSER